MILKNLKNQKKNNLKKKNYNIISDDRYKRP